MLGRWPELFENLGNGCGKRVWWCHKAVDLDSTRRAQMVGAVPVVTSQYQASQLLDLGWSGQFEVIPLGCRIRSCHQQRNPCVAVWSSAFERGLEHLIKIWRGIRRDLPPGSRLEIAGGPHVYREYGEYLVEVERSLRKDTCNESDIVWLGALNPRQLAMVLSSGGILPYQCNVAESFCLSVLEAQAAGCIPIVTPCGALPERVVHGKTGWIETEPRIGERIVEYFRAADSPLVEEIRKAAREAAEALTWDRVACQFQQEVLTK
jgi:glycosyltransferase involved in cell wall biosynthesis